MVRSRGKQAKSLCPCVGSVLKVPALRYGSGLLLGAPTQPSDFPGRTENSSRWTLTVRGAVMGTTVLSGPWGVRFAPEISGSEALTPSHWEKSPWEQMELRPLDLTLTPYRRWC